MMCNGFEGQNYFIIRRLVILAHLVLEANEIDKLELSAEDLTWFYNQQSIEVLFVRTSPQMLIVVMKTIGYIS
uniref:Uncharacterized protein n=1 Tax=Physcomitrium patens TaxID=3218 RepID=A0A2K1L2J1_PHYPA|nr:hypothetical protein PHYPA_003037 [Physcomitrium patens]